MFEAEIKVAPALCVAHFEQTALKSPRQAARFQVQGVPVCKRVHGPQLPEAIDFAVVGELYCAACQQQ